MEKKNTEENSNSKPKSARKNPVKKNKVKEEIDYSYLRSPDSEILMELDKQNNKVKKFDLQRVFDELEWIGKNKCGFVSITDANFGMFVERDNAIVSKLIEVQLRWNSLTSFSITWAKNQKNEDDRQSR